MAMRIIAISSASTPAQLPVCDLIGGHLLGQLVALIMVRGVTPSAVNVRPMRVALPIDKATALSKQLRELRIKCFKRLALI
jgi:hypothetical protein